MQAIRDEFWAVAADGSKTWHWWPWAANHDGVNRPPSPKRRRSTPPKDNHSEPRRPVCQECLDAFEARHAPPLGPEVFVASHEARRYHASARCRSLTTYLHGEAKLVPLRFALARGMHACPEEAVDA